MSVFVAFEGGEGSGKSTQSKLLYERIIAEGFSSLLLHEPGGTSVGEEVRRILWKVIISFQKFYNEFFNRTFTFFVCEEWVDWKGNKT